MILSEYKLKITECEKEIANQLAKEPTEEINSSLNKMLQYLKKARQEYNILVNEYKNEEFNWGIFIDK